VKPVLVELTQRNVFPGLELEGAGREEYIRRTLFPGKAIRALQRRETARTLTKALDELQPAVLLLSGWSLPGAAEGLSWCAHRGVPAVLMSESTKEDEPRKPWKEFVKRRVVRLFRAALVGGRKHRDYVTELGMPANRVFTGYDAVDNGHFAAGADAVREEAAAWRLRLGLPEHYFLVCARFEPKKNLSRLLEGFAAYRRLAGPQAWRLVLLGDGELRPVLERARSQMGIQEEVAMPGFLAYQELPAFYGLAGAFVHASTTEQWGLVVNEAMAAGLPVLVSNRCGCAPDLVEEGGNGFTFDPYDVDGLARLMFRMSALPGEQRQAMGRRSREIIQHWGPERFAEGMRNAVEAALVAPRPRVGLLDKALLWALIHRPGAVR